MIILGGEIMLCYRDRTFCSQQCANTACNRNMNDEVMFNARAWWGTEAEPTICFGDLRTNDCGFIDIKTKELKNDNT